MFVFCCLTSLGAIEGLILLIIKGTSFNVLFQTIIRLSVLGLNSPDPYWLHFSKSVCSNTQLHVHLADSLSRVSGNTRQQMCTAAPETLRPSVAALFQSSCKHKEGIRSRVFVQEAANRWLNMVSVELIQKIHFLKMDWIQQAKLSRTNSY